MSVSIITKSVVAYGLSIGTDIGDLERRNSLWPNLLDL